MSNLLKIELEDGNLTDIHISGLKGFLTKLSEKDFVDFHNTVVQEGNDRFPLD